MVYVKYLKHTQTSVTHIGQDLHEGKVGHISLMKHKRQLIRQSTTPVPSNHLTYDHQFTNAKKTTQKSDDVGLWIRPDKHRAP